MRVLAFLLIFANVCFWFWAHYVDVPESRPVAATVSPAKQPPRLMLATEQPRDPQQAATLTNHLSCVSVGPFSDDSQMQVVAKRLEKAGFNATPRTTEGEVFAGYWVSLQGFATRADAELALARLHAAGVSDAYVMTEDSMPNTLSLGLYSDQSHAQQRRDDIAKLGFAPQLQNRMRHGEVHWLDVALQEPGQLIEPSLLQSEAGGITRLETQACPSAADQVVDAAKK